MRLALVLALLAAAPLARAQEDEEAAPEVETRPEIDPAIFDDALEDFYAQRYVDAAAGFWGYIHFGEPSAGNYEWSQYFLAESLAHLGFWHAATQYYYIVAKTRSRPEILPEALRRLEAISRTRPFNENLVHEDLIYDSEFGTLPKDLDRWVEYVQGLNDYKNDFTRWGERHFENVAPTSYYGLWSLYVQAVHALRKSEDDKALALFETILESKVEAPEVKNKANLGMARLLFDLGRYKEALGYYERVSQIDLSFEQAQLLLEKAWTNYHLGDTRKAMGMLHALDAPSYQKFFLPDAFVLRGLILKDLCHFIEAKRVVRAFKYTYARALDDLRRRLPMEKIPRIFDASTQQGPIARRTAFLRTLADERRRIEDFDSSWEDVELDKHLRTLYDFEIREQERLWRIEFEKSSDSAALELLEVEEQIGLLDYEVGLDIFKRLKAEGARQAREERLVVPYDSANVYYEFDTEYWNDELHSYRYFITSRCFETVEEK
jgi:hypothetical protein